MGATKATLIAVGTLGGLGAVLAYSPPHHTLNLGGGPLKGLGGGSTSTPTQSATPAPTPTHSATPTASATHSSSPSASASAKPSATPTPKKSTPQPAKTTAKATPTNKAASPAKKLVNGTFAGATSKTDYGPVQISITVANSKIVAVTPLQLPSAQPYDIELNNKAVPILTSQTLAAQSSNIQGVSGASYTSQGWYDSLVSALAKAHL
jgi:uncharacterized protein with FMN-binding domain